MSDPVTHHDIEDVLSSIRRLVAQGDPRRQNGAETKPSIVSSTPPAKAEAPVIEDNSEHVAAEAPVERLVLTPAFRITPQAEQNVEAVKDAAAASYDAAVRQPESDVIPTKDPRPMPGPGRSPSERASLEATIAELEAAVNSRSDEWEPDGSEEPDTKDLQSVFASKLEAFRPSRFMRRRNDAEETALEAEIEEEETSPTEATLNDIVVDHIAEAVQEEIAESFPHLTAADEDPADLAEAIMSDVAEEMSAQPAEPEVVEEDVAAFAANVEPEDQSGTVVHLTPGTSQTAANEAAAPEIEAEAWTDDVAMDDFEETPEPVEALVGEEDAPNGAAVAEPVEAETIDVAPAPTFRHAASFNEVYDPVAEATADAAEAAPDAGDIYGDELQPEPAETSTAVATPAPQGQLMDPDMLRDMVSQMIREELQGEMGERITRNVRKLVRREINRVLSAQEFD